MLIYNKSVEGSSHKVSGTPCQDYSLSKEFDKYSIVALSDGHGSKTYVRSDIGSKLACEIAINLTQDFINDNYSTLASLTKIEDYSPDFCKAQNPLFTDLFNKINEAWEAAILKDKNERPFSEREKSLLGTSDIKHAYGCTLIVGVKSNDFTFIFHIGDGRIYTISYLNEWEQPVPWDTDCKDNTTTSLCENNPVYRFRYYFNPTKKQPFIILLCSDGIEDCYGGEHDGNFQSDELVADYSEVLRCFLQDDDFDESCAKFLDGQSKALSHDDMSIALIVDDYEGLSNMWLEMIKIRKHIYEFTLMFKSLEDKVIRGSERIGLIKKNIHRFDKEIEKLNGEISDLDEQIIDIETQISDLDRCCESGETFISYIEEFPKMVNAYKDTPENNPTALVFIKKLIGCVITGLSTILKNLRKEISNNESKKLDFNNKLKQLKKRRDEIHAKSSVYSGSREKELDKLNGLEDSQRQLQIDIDKFKQENEPVKNNKQHEYDQLKQSIRESIEIPDFDVANNTKYSNESTSRELENKTDELRVLNICKFSSQSKDEDITIQTDGKRFFVMYNGGDAKQIDKEAWETLIRSIKSIEKNDILTERISNCIVISAPDKSDEKCISVDSEAALNLWNTCLSLALNYH